MNIDRIKQIDLRDVWPHEAHDFTTWLEDNIDVLSEELNIGLDPESVKREESAGSFSVDLVADNELGETVIIENQLSRSDHDHLGKVLTYAAAFESNTAIWIVGDPRPEHVKAATWLNDSSDLSLYMFKIQAIQIGNSDVAPLLTLIVGPSENSKKIVSSKREKTERHEKRLAFFTALLEYARPLTSLHSNRAPNDGPYQSAATGIAGLSFDYYLTQNSTSVYCWIDKGKGKDDWNKSFYSHLFEHKETIEESYGGNLAWNIRSGETRSRTISDTLQLGGWKDENSWDEVIPQTVDKMIKLEKSLKPFLPEAVKIAESTS